MYELVRSLRAETLALRDKISDVKSEANEFFLERNRAIEEAKRVTFANTKLVELQARQRELTDEVRVREAQIDALTQTVERSRLTLLLRDLDPAESTTRSLTVRKSVVAVAVEAKKNRFAS